MRQISRIVLAAAIVSGLVEPWATAKETAEGERSSVTLLRTANRLPATDIYDEALIQLVGRSALLHDLGELDAFAGQVSTFQLEEVPPGFAISLLVASQPGDGKLTPDSSIGAADVSITLEESESGRPIRPVNGVHQAGWNFPVATEANAIDYPFLLTREGATYAIKLDGKRLEARDHKLHFVLILTPVVPGGLAAGENSSECEHVVDHGEYQRRDFTKRPAPLAKTAAGASQLNLGPIELTPSTRHRFEIHDIPNLPHTIGLLARSPAELADTGIEKIHIYLRVKEGPVLINREFDVKEAKVSRTTGAPDLVYFSHPDSHDWKVVPNTAVGSTFAPRRGDVYILEITITAVDAKQSEGKSIGVMLRS